MLLPNGGNIGDRRMATADFISVL